MKKTEIDEIRNKYDAATQMVYDLCQGKRNWSMSIPANHDRDPDLVIGAALFALQDLLDVVEAPYIAHQERIKRNQELHSDEIEERKSRHAAQVAACAEGYQTTDIPHEIMELRREIENYGEYAVTDSQRNKVIKGMPQGEVTSPWQTVNI